MRQSLSTTTLEKINYPVLIAQHSALLNEPKWLTDKRQSAWQLYGAELLPDRVTHLWKYSDPDWFELDGRNISFEKIKSKLTLSEEAKNKGIILSGLHEALLIEKNKKIIESKLGALTDNYPNKINYLNDATWSNGLFLYIPRGIKLDEPIMARTLINQANKLSALKVLIVLEEEANISFIDGISSNGPEDFLTNIVVEIFLARGSKLNYLNIQTNSKETTQHFFQRALLEDHSELTNLIVALGGKLTKADLGTTLNGTSAGVSTYGIVLGDGVQKFDHHTTIDHKVAHTRSYLNFRVAIKDKARSAYTGNLKIAHEAVKSEAEQENRNLLLSSDARAESIPELEILTNDVIKCNHGVTVGQVDKEQIYYLMSRGLTQKDAERIVIEGFLEPTISRIPLPSLREEILGKIKSKLENL